MKKLLAVTLLLITATQTLAHRQEDCRSRTNRYGNTTTRCTTVRHNHRNTDNYGEGFFDGMLASSLILLTTSDAADDDYNRDFLESEITFTLATSEGSELELTSELQNLVDDTREANEGKEITDEAILEAYLLELSK